MCIIDCGFYGFFLDSWFLIFLFCRIVYIFLRQKYSYVLAFFYAEQIEVKSQGDDQMIVMRPIELTVTYELLLK